MKHADAILHVAEFYLDQEPGDVPKNLLDVHIRALLSIVAIAGGSEEPISQKRNRRKRIAAARRQAERALEAMIARDHGGVIHKIGMAAVPHVLDNAERYRRVRRAIGGNAAARACGISKETAHRWNRLTRDQEGGTP